MVLPLKSLSVLSYHSMLSSRPSRATMVSMLPWVLMSWMALRNSWRVASYFAGGRKVLNQSRPETSSSVQPLSFSM